MIVKDLKKFQVLEASSGGEISDVIEARNTGEAAIRVLEEMGYTIKEIKDE